MISFPKTLTEALAAEGELRVGGTDLTERRHRGVHRGDLVDLRDVPGLDRIEARDGRLHIGAKVRLAHLASNALVRGSYAGLAEATGGLATPQIRAVATVGGNLMQQVRCWYYRHPDLKCAKKGGATCLARAGDHLFHACYDLGQCCAPHPSTLAVAFLAYDAEIVVDGHDPRGVAAVYGDGTDARRHHRLKRGEMVTGVALRPPEAGEQSAWFRAISRARAEWPLAEAVVRLRVRDGRIAMARVAVGGVANIPLAMPEVEAALVGGSPTPRTLDRAAALAVERANPLPMTGYKVGITRWTIVEALTRALAAAPAPALDLGAPAGEE